jgi:tetratricopeptide (TPR) repeat protein
MKKRIFFALFFSTGLVLAQTSSVSDPLAQWALKVHTTLNHGADQTLADQYVAELANLMQSIKKNDPETLRRGVGELESYLVTVQKYSLLKQLFENLAAFPKLPADAEYWVKSGLCRAYLRMQDYDSAVKAAEEVIALPDGHDDGSKFLSFACASSALYAKGDLEGALAQYQSEQKFVATKMATNIEANIHAYDGLALMSQLMGRYERALEYSNQASDLIKKIAHPGTPILAYFDAVRGMVLVFNNEPKGAEKYLREAVRIFDELHAREALPMHTIVRRMLGRLYYENGQYSSALYEVNKALIVGFSKMKGSLLVVKGDILLAQGDLGGARSSYTAALTEAQKSSSNYSDQTVITTQMGNANIARAQLNFKEAQSKIEQAAISVGKAKMVLPSTRIDFLRDWGWILVENNNYPEAKKKFHEAELLLKQNLIGPHLLKGLVALDLASVALYEKDVDAANQLAVEAKNSFSSDIPQTGYLHLIEGLIQFQRGNSKGVDQINAALGALNKSYGKKEINLQAFTRLASAILKK